MVINIANNEKYIPTAGGNDKDKSPIVFNLRFLTSEEQTEMEYMQFSQVGGKDANRYRVIVDHKYIFTRGVESIENCMVGDKVIDTPEKFLSIRGPKLMSEMVKEVALHLYNAMEIDEKN